MERSAEASFRRPSSSSFLRVQTMLRIREGWKKQVRGDAWSSLAAASRRTIPQVYQAILDGRAGEGPICVFPTASAEPQESMESAMSRIDAVGGAGTAIGVFLTVDNPEVAALPATVETDRILQSDSTSSEASKGGSFPFSGPRRVTPRPTTPS